MSEICMTSSLAATRGKIFFPKAVAGADDRRIALRERQDKRRDFFSKAVG